MRTGDIDDLEKINRRLTRFIEEYDSSFEAHSANMDFDVSARHLKGIEQLFKGNKESKAASKRIPARMENG